MNREHSTPENEPREPAPSPKDLFDGISRIVSACGEYNNPGNGVDAPNYTLPVDDALSDEEVTGITLTESFTDQQGTYMEQALHVVWIQGVLTKSVMISKREDGSFGTLSVSEFTDREVINPDTLEEDEEDIDQLDVTDDELRKVGKVLALLRKQYGQ